MIANSESFNGEKMRFRSVWISDIHLGTKHARVEALLEFLRVCDCRYLYIVGDFIDGWQLKTKWHWEDQLQRAHPKIAAQEPQGNPDHLYHGESR